MIAYSVIYIYTHTHVYCVCECRILYTVRVIVSCARQRYKLNARECVILCLNGGPNARCKTPRERNRKTPKKKKTKQTQNNLEIDSPIARRTTNE